MAKGTSKAEVGFEIEGSVAILGGIADPSSGLVAPFGSLYFQDFGGQSAIVVWVKTGGAPTAWYKKSYNGIDEEEKWINAYVGKGSTGQMMPTFIGGYGGGIDGSDSLTLALAKLEVYMGVNLTPVDRTGNYKLNSADDINTKLSSLDNAIGPNSDMSSTNYIGTTNTVYKNLSNIDAQVKVLTTGVKWYTPSPFVITDDVGLNSAPDGTALSTLLPFSDDDAPALTLSDFNFGDYICSRNNGGTHKMFEVYDSGGATKAVRIAGVTQLTAQDTFYVRHDLIQTPHTSEQVNAYRYNGTNIEIFARISVEDADTIAVTSAYSASAGNPAPADSIQKVLQNLDGNNDNQDSMVGGGYSSQSGTNHYGTIFTGAVIPNNSNIAQALQALETRMEELGLPITTTLSASTPADVDSFSISGAVRYEWHLLLSQDSTPANSYGCIITVTADSAGNVDHSRDNIDVIGAEFIVTVDVTNSGGTLALNVETSVATDVKVVRKKIS